MGILIFIGTQSETEKTQLIYVTVQYIRTKIVNFISNHGLKETVRKRQYVGKNRKSALVGHNNNMTKCATGLTLLAVPQI